MLGHVCGEGRLRQGVERRQQGHPKGEHAAGERQQPRRAEDALRMAFVPQPRAAHRVEADCRTERQHDPGLPIPARTVLEDAVLDEPVPERRTDRGRRTQRGHPFHFPHSGASARPASMNTSAMRKPPLVSTPHIARNRLRPSPRSSRWLPAPAFLRAGHAPVAQRDPAAGERDRQRDPEHDPEPGRAGTAHHRLGVRDRAPQTWLATPYDTSSSTIHARRRREHAEPQKRQADRVPCGRRVFGGNERFRRRCHGVNGDKAAGNRS